MCQGEAGKRDKVQIPQLYTQRPFIILTKPLFTALSFRSPPKESLLFSQLPLVLLRLPPRPPRLQTSRRLANAQLPFHPHPYTLPRGKLPPLSVSDQARDGREGGHRQRHLLRFLLD